jgi:UDP:flavonoid glycosyltransferase YjiC (YdhE family)
VPTPRLWPDRPSPAQVAGQSDDKVEIAAARRVLSEPQFRARAASFAEEFARHDTEAEIVRHILAACHRNAAARQTSHA